MHIQEKKRRRQNQGKQSQEAHFSSGDFNCLPSKRSPKVVKADRNAEE